MLKYIDFDFFNSYKDLKAYFSTRNGGVSEGIYSTMNLSFSQGDVKENVIENFRIFGKTIGVECEDMVFAHQTHTSNVIPVDSSNKGMGILRERNFSNVDGLVTNEKGLCLVTSHSDCIPLYFFDPVKKVIGLSHSGWKGTIGNIALNTIKLMNEKYGSDAEDILAMAGPGICGKCYEVGSDVADVFTYKYKDDSKGRVVTERENVEGKYLLDLHMANYYNFLSAGITEDHIYLSGVCTYEDSDNLWSHRASHGKRGGGAAFMMLL